MKPRTKRALAIGAGLATLGLATALVLNAFQSNLVFFFSPSQIAANEAPRERSFRVGGLVEEGSVTRGSTPEGRPSVAFRVTDGRSTVGVQYAGVLPDLFREGQGVVTLGQMGPGGVFMAREVLARHDENYMPPEVAEALRRSGHWNPASGTAPPAGVRPGA